MAFSFMWAIFHAELTPRPLSFDLQQVRTSKRISSSRSWAEGPHCVSPMTIVARLPSCPREFVEQFYCSLSNAKAGEDHIQHFLHVHDANDLSESLQGLAEVEGDVLRGLFGEQRGLGGGNVGGESLKADLMA